MGQYLGLKSHFINDELRKCGEKLIDESMVKVIPEKNHGEIVNFLESFHQLKPFFDEH